MPSNPPEPRGKWLSAATPGTEAQHDRQPRLERWSGGPLPFHQSTIDEAINPADKLGRRAAELLTTAYRQGEGQGRESEAIEQAINPNLLLVQALHDHWHDWNLDSGVDFGASPDAMPAAGKIIMTYFANTPALSQTILNGTRGTEASPSLPAIRDYLARAVDEMRTSTTQVKALLRAGGSLTPQLAVALMIEANWSTWEPALKANAQLGKHYDVWPQIMDCEDYVGFNRAWVIAMNKDAGYPADGLLRIDALRRWTSAAIDIEMSGGGRSAGPTSGS